MPVGSVPTVDNVTLSPKSPVAEILTLYVAMSPGNMVFVAGVADSANDDTTYGVTVRSTVAWWTSDPLVAVIAIPECVPVGVAAVVVNDIVDVPVPLLSCAGLNDALVPDGRPDTLSWTGDEKPLVPFKVTA